MDSAEILPLIFLLTAATVTASGGNRHSVGSDIDPSLQVNPTNLNEFAASSATGRTFSNQFLTIAISPGWTVRSVDQILDLTHGEYILSINPVFTHASGVIGGRFSEIVAGKPSINAVMRNVDQPAGGWECAQTEKMVVSRTIWLVNLYTEKFKTGNGCIFPLAPQPVWFGSVFSGSGSESDYAITLAYDSGDVNGLPKRGSQELRNIFRDVVAMLKTLSLKPPVVITNIDPEAAPPGAAATVHGRGFRIYPNSPARLIFREFPNNPMPAPTVAPDGNSLTFLVPRSIDTISCEPGYVDVDENCIPVPADHVDAHDCPESAKFCGMATPPRTYHLMVELGGGISSNSVPFAISPSAPARVSICLLYPNGFVSPGDVITVRGNGFTRTDNTVKIGSAVVNNLSSLDGTTITFLAPAPAGESFIPGIRIYSAFVSNANGSSNPISFSYR